MLWIPLIHGHFVGGVIPNCAMTRGRIGPVIRCPRRADLIGVARVTHDDRVIALDAAPMTGRQAYQMLSSQGPAGHRPGDGQSGLKADTTKPMAQAKQAP